MSDDRLIAHLDMDAFYASVELLHHPELRGLPVVVGGRRRLPDERLPADPARWPRLASYAGRGVVTTATYEARALGVHSAMGLMKAAALAPQAVLLPPDFERYRDYSRRFKAAVRAIAPVVEDRGIDEIYIDLTEVPGARDGTPRDPLAGVRRIALALKAAVKDATGLTCSVGVTPNKLLSKISSDLDKPDGLVLVTRADIPQRIWPLVVEKVNGIGPHATERLHALGIRTVGELAAAPVATLVERFGARYGAWLHAAALGQDDRPVVTFREPVSMSRETTFERDLHARTDRRELGAIFTHLCERVADDLQRKGYAGRNVAIKLRYDDFRTVTRAITLEAPVADARAIRHAATECLRRVPLDHRLRLLGVRVGALVHAADIADAAAAPETLPLF